MPINLLDLAAAHRAYAQARAAITKAAAPEGDAANLNKQQQASLNFLQTRVLLLTEARTKATSQYDDGIAQLQQRIGQIQQSMANNKAAPAEAGKPPAPDKKA